MQEYEGLTNQPYQMIWLIDIHVGFVVDYYPTFDFKKKLVWVGNIVTHYICMYGFKIRVDYKKCLVQK